MRLSRLLMCLFLTVGFGLPTVRSATPAVAFSHPDRIRYDGHCMTIEGKDVFIYSAAFHYFRVPRELWRDRFTRIKQAGFNTVETYVPWNWHERDMPSGLKDFSKIDLSEFQAWLKMAQEEFGFYTIVRPGPFICAEWAGGGYPRWLAKFGPGQGGFWLRGADPAHIAWSVHWYEAVGKVFASEQITRKPKGAKGIIMAQIENEYNYHKCEGKTDLLRALYGSLKHSGLEVPIFTCMTKECRGSNDPELSQVFDCDNYYLDLTKAPECAQRMVSLRAAHPNAPGFVTELQGGWFSLVGGSLSEDHYSDSRHFNAICMMSMLGGATGLNPYVFIGGTHFEDWGARGMVTSYDYNAPVREWGAVGAKYTAACEVGQFIAENQANLVRAEGGPCELKNAPTTLAGGVRVAPDGTRFVFLHNTDKAQLVSGTVTVVPGAAARSSGPIYNIDQNGNRVLVQAASESGTNGGSQLPSFEVTYQLDPIGAKVLVIPPGKSPEEGTWYPKPQPPIKRPAELPGPVRITSALKHDEAFAVNWKPLPAGKSLPELGVSDQRYTAYSATFNLSAEEAATLNRLLINSFSRDIITAQINGKLPKRTQPSDDYAAKATRNKSNSGKRIQPNDFDNAFDVSGLLQSGSNSILLLYENIGFEHGYVPMEELSGVRNAGLSGDDKAIAKPLDWKVATDLGGIVNGWTQPGFAPRNWNQVQLDTTMQIPRKGNNIQPKGAPDALLTWYRLEFELPAADPKVWIPWRLLINASGNGEMYLNGHDIGRHHEAGPQREFFLPECWLKFGPGRKNVLVLGLRQTIHGAVVKAAEVSPYPDSAEVR